MYNKKFKIAILLFTVVLLYSCSSFDDSKIVGYYEIDKYIPRDTTIKNVTYNFLNLRSNKTFRLNNIIGKDSIIGTWKIIKSINEEEGIIQFDFNNKQIQTSLKGSIFTFEYPNDFYSGFYVMALYIKLTRPPEGIGK